MPEPELILVLLRQPRKNDPDETRSDPFWEFGSFGCTSCHCTNLMHPQNADSILGCQLAFSQGGPHGFRLVYLTPSVSEVVIYCDRVEARWSPVTMPIRYSFAPMLIDNDGKTDAPSLKRMIMDVKRDTWCGKFASKFRSRKEPLDRKTAKEINKTYKETVSDGGKTALSTTYVDALPYLPSKIDSEREMTYQRYLSKLGSKTVCKKLKPPTECHTKELDDFHQLALESEQVKSCGLRNRIERAKLLAFHYREDTLVGIVALKRHNETYKKELFRKAGANEEHKKYILELGWAFTLKEHRGNHICSNLVKRVVTVYEFQNMFATTRTDNLSMQRILTKNGFRKLGKPYKGRADAHYLQLFTRKSVSDYRQN